MLKVMERPASKGKGKTVFPGRAPQRAKRAAEDAQRASRAAFFPARFLRRAARAAARVLGKRSTLASGRRVRIHFLDFPVARRQYGLVNSATAFPLEVKGNRRASEIIKVVAA